MPIALVVALVLASGATVVAVAADGLGVARWVLLGAMLVALNALVLLLLVRERRVRRDLFERSLELGQQAARFELQRGLVASEHLFRVIVEHAPEGIIVSGDDGVIQAANPAAHALFGHRDGALVGARVGTLIGTEPVATDVVPDDGDGAHPVLRAGCRADGGELVVSVTTRAVQHGTRDLTISLARDITPIIERARHADAERRAALDRERAHSELLATMTHEVRTPLGGVMGMVQLLADESLTEDQQELVLHIQRSSRALVEVLDDMLNASTLRGAELVFDQAPFDILELVEEVVVLHHDGADRKGLELVLGAAPELRRELVGDPHRVRQVIGNLVGNAIKYTHAGHVRVDVATRELAPGEIELMVTVRDTGVGIPAERLEDIFARYARVSDASTPTVAGTGLGLAIAREIARKMDGDVTARSTPGEGSELTFVARVSGGREVVPTRLMAGARVLVALRSRVSRELVTRLLAGHGAHCVTASGARHLTEALERARERGQAFSVALVDVEILAAAPALHLGRVPLIAAYPLGDRDSAREASKRGATGALRRPLLPSQLLEVLAAAASGELAEAPMTSRVRRPSRPRDAPARFAGRRVLVAEDNPTNQRVAVVMIGKLGCEVEVAVDGREAIRMARDGRYDLVFMDCQMPELDGYDATREIREWGGDFAALPIVALTASTSDADRARSLDAGMSDHLTKPVTRDAFERVLARWLDDGRGRDQAMAASR